MLTIGQVVPSVTLCPPQFPLWTSPKCSTVAVIPWLEHRLHDVLFTCSLNSSISIARLAWRRRSLHPPPPPSLYRHQWTRLARSYMCMWSSTDTIPYRCLQCFHLNYHGAHSYIVEETCMCGVCGFKTWNPWWIVIHFWFTSHINRSNFCSYGVDQACVSACAHFFCGFSFGVAL